MSSSDTTLSKSWRPVMLLGTAKSYSLSMVLTRTFAGCVWETESESSLIGLFKYSNLAFRLHTHPLSHTSLQKYRRVGGRGGLRVWKKEGGREKERERKREKRLGVEEERVCGHK